MLKKLLSELRKLKYEEYILANDDELFKYVNIQKLKEEYNNIKNKNTIIKIYKKPKIIDDDITTITTIKSLGYKENLGKTKTQLYLEKNEQDGETICE